MNNKKLFDYRKATDAIHKQFKKYRFSAAHSMTKHADVLLDDVVKRFEQELDGDWSTLSYGAEPGAQKITAAIGGIDTITIVFKDDGSAVVIHYGPVTNGVSYGTKLTP